MDMPTANSLITPSARSFRQNSGPFKPFFIKCEKLNKEYNEIPARNHRGISSTRADLAYGSPDHKNKHAVSRIDESRHQMNRTLKRFFLRRSAFHKPCSHSTSCDVTCFF